MNKIKVILSTLGPLHLIKSAEYLSSLVDIKVIQGWIPSWWNRFLLKPISHIIGYDLRRTIKKRTPACLNGHNIGIGFPEFAVNATHRLIKNKSYNNSISTKFYKMYGWLSHPYIKDAQIFHVRSGSGGGNAIEKAKRQGMKVVVDHSIAHPLFMDKQMRNEYEKYGKAFDLGLDNPFWRNVDNDCKKADVILVNSFFVKDTFIEAGYDADKIKIAYLGVRPDFFNLKTDYSIDDEIKILFTGGFGFRKGAEYILRAMHELDTMSVKYSFTVVGSNAEAQDIIKNIPVKKLNLVGFVPQDDLKKYLSESDIYLFPSLCEGCASSGMEALAAGLPVIATKESGLPVTDGTTGLVVESKSVKAITEAILKLKGDKELRETLGKNAARLIKTDYTWEKYAENVVSVYNEILK